MRRLGFCAMDGAMPRSPRAPSAALPASGALRAWAWRLAPVLVSVAALFALLRKYSPAAIAEQIGHGRPAAVVPIAFGLSCAYLLWGAFLDTSILKSFEEARFGVVARGKAGTAVLTALGYVFGSGGYGVWLSRALGVSAPEAGGLVGYFMASDLAALGLVATLSAWLGGATMPAGLRVAAASLAAAQLALVLVGRHLPTAGRFTAVLAPYRRVPAARSIAQILGRSLNIALAVVATWAASRAFGLSIPFVVMATYVPVVLLVSSLPLNIAGFGVAQGVWLVCFQGWEPAPRLLAFGFVWQAAMSGSMVLRGLPFVRRAVADIERGRLLVRSA